MAEVPPVERSITDRSYTLFSDIWTELDGELYRPHLELDHDFQAAGRFARLKLLLDELWRNFVVEPHRSRAIGLCADHTFNRAMSNPQRETSQWNTA